MRLVNIKPLDNVLLHNSLKGVNLVRVEGQAVHAGPPTAPPRHAAATPPRAAYPVHSPGVLSIVVVVVCHRHPLPKAPPLTVPASYNEIQRSFLLCRPRPAALFVQKKKRNTVTHDLAVLMLHYCLASITLGLQLTLAHLQPFCFWSELRSCLRLL